MPCYELSLRFFFCCRCSSCQYINYSLDFSSYTSESRCSFLFSYPYSSYLDTHSDLFSNRNFQISYEEISFCFGFVFNIDLDLA